MEAHKHNTDDGGTQTQGFSEEDTFHYLLRFAGPLMFMAMQVSSLSTARQVYTSGSVGNMSIFPFLSMWSNSFLWTLYGLLRNDYTVWVPNFTGSIVGLVGTYLFHMNSPAERYERESKYYFFLAGLITLYGMVCAAYSASAAIGSLAVLMCVVLMGSPLVVLRTVIQDRSCESMPFWTSLTIWLNTLSWSLYGLLDAHDFNIYFPNMCGLFLGSIQMVLFMVFGCGERGESLPTTRVHSISATVITPIMGSPTGPVIPVRTKYTPLASDGNKPAYLDTPTK